MTSIGSHKHKGVSCRSGKAAYLAHCMTGDIQEVKRAIAKEIEAVEIANFYGKLRLLYFAKDSIFRIGLGQLA
jgi:hypothetical protein